MGGRKYIFLLWGLLLIAFACEFDSSALNFKELEDSVFKVEVEVNERESMTEIRCVQMKQKKEDNHFCPGNLLQLIGKMKLTSIQRGMKNSKTRSNWVGGAFELDLYYTVMEIHFVKDPTVRNDGFILGIKTTSKMRGHQYICCRSSENQPDHSILYESFNVVNEGASNLFTFSNEHGMDVQINEDLDQCYKSTLGTQCWLPQYHVKYMVENENAMLKMLLGTNNFKGFGSVQVLKAFPNFSMNERLENQTKSSSVYTVWLTTEEYSTSFLGKNFLNMNEKYWERVWEFMKTAPSSGVDSYLGVYTMIFSTFVLFLF